MSKNILKTYAARQLLQQYPQLNKQLTNILIELAELANSMQSIAECQVGLYAILLGGQIHNKKMFAECLTVFKEYFNSRYCVNVHRDKSQPLKLLGWQLPARFGKQVIKNIWVDELNNTLEDLIKNLNIVNTASNKSRSLITNKSVSKSWLPFALLMSLPIVNAEDNERHFVWNNFYHYNLLGYNFEQPAFVNLIITALVFVAAILKSLADNKQYSHYIRYFFGVFMSGAFMTISRRFNISAATANIVALIYGSFVIIEPLESMENIHGYIGALTNLTPLLKNYEPQYLLNPIFWIFVTDYIHNKMQKNDMAEKVDKRLPPPPSLRKHYTNGLPYLQLAERITLAFTFFTQYFHDTYPSLTTNFSLIEYGLYGAFAKSLSLRLIQSHDMTVFKKVGYGLLGFINAKLWHSLTNENPNYILALPFLLLTRLIPALPYWYEKRHYPQKCAAAMLSYLEAERDSLRKKIAENDKRNEEEAIAAFEKEMLANERKQKNFQDSNAIKAKFSMFLLLPPEISVVRNDVKFTVEFIVDEKATNTVVVKLANNALYSVDKIALRKKIVAEINAITDQDEKSQCWLRARDKTINVNLIFSDYKFPEGIEQLAIALQRIQVFYQAEYDAENAVQAKQKAGEHAEKLQQLKALNARFDTTRDNLRELGELVSKIKPHKKFLTENPKVASRVTRQIPLARALSELQNKLKSNADNINLLNQYDVETAKLPRLLAELRGDVDLLKEFLVAKVNPKQNEKAIVAQDAKETVTEQSLQEVIHLPSQQVQLSASAIHIELTALPVNSAPAVNSAVEAIYTHPAGVASNVLVVPLNRADDKPAAGNDAVMVIAPTTAANVDQIAQRLISTVSEYRMF